MLIWSEHTTKLGGMRQETQQYKMLLLREELKVVELHFVAVLFRQRTDTIKI